VLKTPGLSANSNSLPSRASALVEVSLSRREPLQEPHGTAGQEMEEEMPGDTQLFFLESCHKCELWADAKWTLFVVPSSTSEMSHEQSC